MTTAHQRGQILPVFCLLLALLLLPVAGLAVDGGVLLSSHASLVGAAEATAEDAAQAVKRDRYRARKDVPALHRTGRESDLW